MADRDLMKFNKGKSQVMLLGRNNPRHQYRLWANWLEGSSAEEDVVEEARLDGVLSNLV